MNRPMASGRVGPAVHQVVSRPPPPASSRLSPRPPSVPRPSPSVPVRPYRSLRPFTSPSAFRLPPSAFRLPPSAFRLPRPSGRPPPSPLPTLSGPALLPPPPPLSPAASRARRAPRHEAGTPFARRSARAPKGRGWPGTEACRICSADAVRARPSSRRSVALAFLSPCISPFAPAPRRRFFIPRPKRASADETAPTRPMSVRGATAAAVRHPAPGRTAFDGAEPSRCADRLIGSP